MFESDDPKTTTIITIDLPPSLGLRLRVAMERRGRKSLRKVALEALEAWLDDDELERGELRQDAAPATPGNPRRASDE